MTKSTFIGGAIGAALTIPICLAAGSDYDSSLRGSIKIDGSSTVYPITEAVAEEFAEVCPRVRVTVGISGTGGGMKRFTVGETDISDASRPIKDKEYKVAVENGIEFVEIPVAYDGLSIVVNKANHWVDHLSVDDLKRIFLDGSPVKTWRVTLRRTGLPISRYENCLSSTGIWAAIVSSPAIVQSTFSVQVFVTSPSMGAVI